MTFADRVTHLAPEGAYHMLARAQALEAQGRRIIHLEIGQPDVPTFGNIKAAGIQAIEDNFTRYTPPAGMPALREAIAEDAGARRSMSFNPAQVVVGPGTKPILFFPTLALRVRSMSSPTFRLTARPLRGGPSSCSRRPASRCCPERRSAAAARATYACASATRWSTFARPRTASLMPLPGFSSWHSLDTPYFG